MNAFSNVESIYEGGNIPFIVSEFKSDTNPFEVTFVEKNATTCKVKAPSTALIKANLRATLTDKPEVFVDYAIESKRT